MSTPLMTQLTLDLFGDQARREAERTRGEERRAAFVDSHQVGQIRLPWETAGGDKAGDLIPAWQCCACDGIEASEFTLHLNHGCCEGWAWMPRCQNPPRSATGPFDAHWIPPSTEDVTR